MQQHPPKATATRSTLRVEALSHGLRPSMTLMESYQRASVMPGFAETRADRVRACIVATHGRESRDTGVQGCACRSWDVHGPHVAHESRDGSVGV